MLGQNVKNAERTGWVSILINFILSVLKYWAGVVSGSVAIIADAWHTLSDSISSAIVIVGVRISSRPADREHPFGHGRAELLAAIVIGAILGFFAVEFGIDGLLGLAVAFLILYAAWEILRDAYHSFLGEKPRTTWRKVSVRSAG